MFTDPVNVPVSSSGKGSGGVCWVCFTLHIRQSLWGTLGIAVTLLFNVCMNTPRGILPFKSHSCKNTRPLWKLGTLNWGACLSFFIRSVSRRCSSFINIILCVCVKGETQVRGTSEEKWCTCCPTSTCASPLPREGTAPPEEWGGKAGVPGPALLRLLKPTPPAFHSVSWVLPVKKMLSFNSGYYRRQTPKYRASISFGPFICSSFSDPRPLFKVRCVVCKLGGFKVLEVAAVCNNDSTGGTCAGLRGVWWPRLGEPAGKERGRQADTHWPRPHWGGVGGTDRRGEVAAAAWEQKAQATGFEVQGQSRCLIRSCRKNLWINCFGGS